MDRLNVLVLFGGMAEEHDISVKSAKSLAEWIARDRYSPIYVYIARDGAWRRVDTPQADLNKGAQVCLSPSRNLPGLWTFGEETAQSARIDVAFPMLHGHMGEDGAIQGLLELSGIPYVGCDVQGSVLGMDKSLAYLVAAQAGVEVPRHRLLCAQDRPSPGDLSFPLFVKPARSGSSFGVSKVYQQSTLEDAVRDARAYDDRVLIEESVAGREIGCAMRGNSDVLTGEPDEIALSGGFFRVHQEKQPERGSENATVHVPARIADGERALITDCARRVYRALGLRGLARVDLFLTPDGRVVLNEVNTMPGFTSYSRYPRMMEASGHSMRDVITELIELAREGRF